MRFSVQRETILKPLQLASGVVERKQTLPILSNVLINIQDNQLSITATDLEVEMIAYAKVENAQDGVITLPARKFMDICRALPEDSNIEISLDKERASLRSGKSRFVLSTLPAEEFPNIDTIQQTVEIRVPQNTLRTLLDKTHFAMAQQDVRYYLNGLLLEVANGILRTVATDGHRLALCEQELDIKIDENQQIIIPRKGVLELTRLLGDSDELVTLQIGSNHIRVSTGDISFTSKLIDGRFPDYQRVVPQGGDKIVTTDRESLRQALTRASILSNERYRSVRFQLSSGSLRVLANNPDLEEAEEELAVDYEGGHLDVGFNANYITDALSAIDEEQVQLILSDSNSCCLMHGCKNQDSKYVVMPMRI